MISTIVQRVREYFAGLNLFNRAFFSFLGGGYTSYDPNNTTYLNRGYNENPDVYACINQMATKTVSVPYEVKKIKDKKAFARLTSLKLATKGQNNLIQLIQQKLIALKAFDEKEIAFPLERPNETQTWSDIIYLFKTYLKVTGNVYLYILSPLEGQNAGVPIQVYVLPSHLVQIVLKQEANILGLESPISHYVLTEGAQYIEFDARDVIHIKYANPNFDMAGSHLYGMSPLKAALRNINSQNSTIDNNLKMMQNSGAYGFIHGKSTPLTPEQAQSLKDRLVMMDASPERLSHIAGSSAEIGFTRISLTTDELKPFDYLKYDQKAICNVLNWPDELLNNDGKARLGSGDTQEARKQAVTDNILPDLKLLEDSLNTYFLPRFKGYENTVIEWDVTELPEMQTDIKQMVEWLNAAPITPNEFRQALKYETLPDDGMDIVWLPTNKQRIDDITPGMIDNANSV